MNVIHIENDHKYKVFNDDFFHLLTKRLITLIDYKYQIEINIIICSRNEIKLLNKRYRLIDKATDVLSFPIDAKISLVNKWGYNLLGDIYMCDYIIKSNADKSNISYKREYSYMFLHSLLHLMGYDHIKDNEEIQMDKYIKEILKNEGIIN